MRRNERRATVSEEQLSGDAVKGDWLVIDVRFDSGEMGRTRGYYLGVGYEGREVDGGCVSRSFAMFASSTSHLLAEAARFNAKALSQYAERAPEHPLLQAMRERVLAMRQTAIARRERERAEAEASRQARLAATVAK